ncbi:hypothetical protein V8C37DRAFT_360999 [Trichoderma ceciliae]
MSDPVNAIASLNKSNKMPTTLSPYVPKVIDNGDPIYFMSATHRGDMYHLRAAMQLPSRNYSLVLFDSNHTNSNKTKTKDLEDYLTKSVLKNKKHVFVVPWTYKQLNPNGNAPPPKDFTGCFLDGEAYKGKDSDGKAIQRHNLVKYGERDSTIFISQQPSIPQAVVDGMAILSDTSRENLPKQFKKIWQDSGIEPNQPAILFQYRDTGTSKSMGVYPELDTGNAISEIRTIVDKLPTKGSDKLKIFSCGLDGAPTGTGIGKYWEKISNPKPGNDTTRDIEAYFLKWSFDNGYYSMASGFRSGPLDLFTFMGIPTVSIGLRNMMGEQRHKMLAKGTFQRVNIQYDQPRHPTTTCIEHKGNAPTVIGSPFWGNEQEFKPPPGAVTKRAKPKDQKDKEKQQMKEPQPLAPFDKVVMDIGFRVACQQYLDWPHSIETMKTSFPNIIDTHVARFCYPNEAEQRKYLETSEGLDRGDIEAMRSKLRDSVRTLQQSDRTFGMYENALQVDWTEIHAQLGDENAYDD